MVTLPLNLLWVMSSAIGAGLVWLIRLEAQVRLQARLHTELKERLLEDLNYLRTRLDHWTPAASGSGRR